jgi:predicted dehydrogenase
MAITTGECDRMISAAKKNRVMLSVYQSRHWDGCIMKAVEKLRSKPIGEVVRIHARMGGWSRPRDWWRSSKSISGGVLFDWGAHLLEYTFQILDSDIVEVTGFTKSGFWAGKTAWKKDTNEDEGSIVVRYANGAWSTMTVSSIDSRENQDVIEVVGTEGSYLFNHETWRMITHEDGEVVVRKGRNPRSRWSEYYRNIANHLIRGEKLVITAELSRRIIHVIDLGLVSSKRGKGLKPKYS